MTATADRPPPDVIDAPGRRVPSRRAVVGLGAGLIALAVFVAATLELTHGDGGVAGLTAALLRFVRYLGTLVAAGGVVFLAVVRPVGQPVAPRSRSLVLFAAAVAAAAILLSVPVQAAYLTGSVADVVDPQLVWLIVDSGFGTSAIAGFLGLVLLAAAVVKLPHPMAVPAGLAALLLCFGAFLLTGHSVTSEPRLLALGANFAHVAAGAVWLGGLVLLPLALRERRDADDAVGGARLVARFSSTATMALVSVAAAGSALAWVEVRAVAAFATPYGLMLAAKIAVVAAVTAAGAYNNRRLVPAIRRDPTGGWDRLTRVVRLETFGLVAVLALTAVLVNINPARIEAGVGQQFTAREPLGDDHEIEMVIEPARPGTNEVHLYLLDDDGRPTDLAESVTFVFTPPGASEPASSVTPVVAGPGHYLYNGDDLSADGRWGVSVVVDTRDGDELERAVEVPVGDAATDEQAARCGDEEATPDQGHQHLVGGAEPPVPYLTSPPTSGWHYREPDHIPVEIRDEGEPLTEAEQVSVLAVSSVVISYHDLGDDELALLVDHVTARYEGRVALTPYDGIESGEVALTAWRTKQVCDGVDTAVIDDFVGTHAAAEPDYSMGGTGNDDHDH